MSKHIEARDIIFLQVAENGLVKEGVIDPHSVDSNFGKTNFLGVGKVPKEVLTHMDALLYKFVPEKWRGQSSQLIRIEAKMCSEGVHIIEIEQRPCGLGVFMEACKRFSVSADTGVRLNEITVLHSAGRIKEGVFFSDEHLFTDNIFQWDNPREVSNLIIRSREDERIPHWLNARFCSETPPRMFLLRRNADKATTYRSLSVPYRIFPFYRGDARVSFTAHVKKSLSQVLHDFKCRRCVVKPRRGSRAREVTTLNIADIYGLNKRSGIVRSLRKVPKDYVIQPYYRGIHEQTGVCHLYRLFYRKTEQGWQHVGGFLTLDSLKTAKMIVHGHERTKNILIVP